MKTQEHGNVSAMATCQESVRINTKPVLFSLLAIACIVLTGCYYNPPKDGNGNLPQDSVRNFIELVKAGDYEAARNLWYGDPMLPPSIQDDFEEFCLRYKKIDMSKCKISKARKGKADFSMVRVDWEENGQEKYVYFGLKIMGGRWKMQRGYKW